MTIWKKKERPVEIIAFMGLLAALDAVMALFGALFPAASLFLLLLIPISSALVALLCPYRYLPVFVLAAFGVSMGVSFWNFQSTLFYLLPSLLIGAVYGVLHRQKFPKTYLIFLVSLAEFGLFYLSVNLMNFLYEIKVQTLLLALFGLTENAYSGDIFLLFCLAYSFAQIALTELVLRFVLKRLGETEEEAKFVPFLSPVMGLGFLLLVLPFAFFLPSLSYFFLGCGFYFMVASLFENEPLTKIWLHLVMGALVFGGVLAFAGFYASCPNNTGLLLCGIPFFGVTLTCLINALIVMKKPASSVYENAREE